MLFHFDYGDDWFFLVTCTAVKESAAKRRFKKVLSTRGTPPVQYPDYEKCPPPTSASGSLCR